MRLVEADSGEGTGLIAIESYGVRLDIRLDDASLAPALLPLLPPGWSPAHGTPAEAEFALIRDGESRFRVLHDSEPASPPVDLDVALNFLDARIRGTVAFRARDRVFIHAGVVARDGRALVLPGDSFSGKTTLIAALVRAGAIYYSDEFAVVDPEGLVHPFPKPLSIRGARGEQAAEVPASELGGTTGQTSTAVAVVALTTFVPGGRWDPKRVEPGEAALALLAHALPARKRPAEALRAVRNIAADCICLRSERGEAEPAARALLAELAQ